MMVNRFWEKQPEEFASFGTVLRSEKNGLGISSQVDVQAARAVHPYGIYSLPCEQDEVLMLPTQDGKYVLLGVTRQAGELESGEILLQAKSGAYLKLRSDGCAELNGMVIDPSGVAVTLGKERNNG